MSGQEELFDLLFNKNEVTWQSMLYDLVRSEKMDPWDIDIRLIARRFLETVRQMKEGEFRISGKVILAAAILLKIKSNRLVGEDISNLDKMINRTDEEDEEGLLDDIEMEEDMFDRERNALKDASLIPRMPQPRKRKVSIYDLVGALQKAMEVKKRRVMRDIPSEIVKAPEKKMDVSEMIQNIYSKISSYLSKNKQKLTFSRLIPSESREGKVYTFIPLLHLTNQRKIDLNQDRHFGEIEIEMLRQETSKQAENELNADS